jgi:hypothetical protein
MMRTYIIFIYATFEDHDDLEYFCLEHFVQVSESGVKYVIESLGNCVIIFESEKNEEQLREDVRNTLKIEHIKFYFMFEREDLYLAHLPESLKDFIYKPIDNKKMSFDVRVMYEDFNLDEILEKIQKEGVDSLTDEEKKYLDGFGK